MLRTQVAGRTALGRQAAALIDAGDLVPDDLVVSMLLDRIGAEDAAGGFVLDGFPRNLAQARVLQDAPGGAIDRVVVFVVNEDEVVRRLAGRRGCPDGHTYHLGDRPPLRPGVCDVDGKALEQRPDDTEEVVRNRLAVYHRETEPLIGFYDSLGLIVEIKGLGPVEAITLQIKEALRR
jgi:adenylate kinase